ncbi:MAG TPA: 50S ribosomal protein L11 methyltransferase [Trebonia sp.]
MKPEAEALVRSATARTPVPFVPEITLLTAAEPFALWEASERDAPPFWAFPWAGGQGLARYVLDHPETVAGRSVLDVASGSGLVAIAAAKAGARTVLAGDIDANALTAIALNAAANRTPQVTARPVDLAAASSAVSDSWAGGEDAPGAARTRNAPDVVLAADVFYQRDLAALALAFLRAARRAGATVLAADPARAFVPRSELVPLKAYEIPVLSVLEDISVKTVTVYRLP